MAFQDEDEVERRGKSGLDKNSGPPRHDSITFLRFQGKCLYFGGVFGKTPSTFSELNAKEDTPMDC